VEFTNKPMVACDYKILVHKKFTIYQELVVCSTLQLRFFCDEH